MDKTIDFPAEIIKVQTMQDYGIRITLDMPETCVLQAAELMECIRNGVTLQIKAKLIHNNTRLQE